MVLLVTVPCGGICDLKKDSIPLDSLSFSSKLATDSDSDSTTVFLDIFFTEVDCWRVPGCSALRWPCNNGPAIMVSTLLSGRLRCLTYFLKYWKLSMLQCCLSVHSSFPSPDFPLNFVNWSRILRYHPLYVPRTVQLPLTFL